MRAASRSRSAGDPAGLRQQADPAVQSRRTSRPAVRQWLVAVLSLALSVLAADSSVAAEGVSFAVSPSRLVFAAEPGKTAAQLITVYNQDDSPLEVRAQISDFLIDDSTAPTTTFAVTDWVRTDVTSLRLEPASQATIQVIVEVPEGAAPGGYQVGLFITSAPAGTGEIAVSGRLGAAVLIELAPEGRSLRREIQVTSNDLFVEFPDDLSLDALFAPRARSEARVVNVGETFVRAVAVDAYRSWAAGEPIERQAAASTILRGAAGAFVTSGPVLPWFGPASVTTEIVYERGAQDFATIVVQAETFIVPWRLLGLALLVAASIVGLFLWRRRRSDPIRRGIAGIQGTAP